MKKLSFIILLASFTTTFIACGGGNDGGLSKEDDYNLNNDEARRIYTDFDKVKHDLQLQIDALSSRLSALESRMDVIEDRISALEAEVVQIKKDIQALDSRVGNLEEELAKLQNRIKAAEDKIAELEDYVKNTIYEVKVEETIDAVIGTINLTFQHIPTLMSYYGMNASGITTFPTKKSSVHVYNGDGADTDLTAGQYASQIDPFMDGVTPLSFNNLGAQLAQNTNNAGTIYFSLNPVSIDISNITFDIIDNKGDVYPYELSDIRFADYDLLIVAGMHGEILNEGETTNEYLYEAKVNLPMTQWDQVISKNLNDTWKTTSSLSAVKDMVDKVKAAKDESSKVEASKVLVKEALKWIQTQYKKTYTDKEKMNNLGLRATGKVNIVKSATRILVAAVEPLSYKTFWELDQNGKNTPNANIADAEKIEKAVAEAIKFIGKKASDIKGGFEASGSTLALGGETIKSGDLAVGMFKAIVNNLPYSNNILEKLKSIYSVTKNDDTAAVTAKVSNFLSKVSAKLASVGGENYFYNMVTPIVLFESTDGIDRLSPGMHLKTNDYNINLILTSPTEEYLVPAMYKYIAVRHGDKIIDAKIISGQQKVTNLNIRQGECEIIYQTVDYSGYVVTKSYIVTFE